MAKTPQSRKAKGNRLERDVAKLYVKYEIDPTATRMPMSGAITNMKGDIHKRYDWQYVDECKQQERIQFWAWWEQAVSQCTAQQRPVLHISSNHRPILTVINIETYMDLRAMQKQLEEILDGED